MSVWLEVPVLVCSLLLLLPVLVLALEVLAALPSGRASDVGRKPGLRCCVLVPAHDEEASIDATLSSIKTQLRPDDRLLVVADNCNDRTAEVARLAGCEVVERTDPRRRGKGYALDCGVHSLAESPPDVVVMIDADCLIGPGAIDLLVEEAARTVRPIQAVYLMDTPPGAGVLSQVSAFAFRFKNFVRPLGLAGLGFPCLLTGTGMAFPWPVLKKAPLASGNIVEDMQLGLDLACAGYSPKLCASARINGVLPTGAAAAARQRTRWEHGHMRTLLTQVPRLAWAAVRQCRLDLLGLALELSVPPLSILVLLFLVTGILWSLVQAPLSGLLLACGGGVFTATVILAWARFGRSCLRFTSLLSAPFYVLTKIPILLSFIVKPQRDWIRTARTEAPPPETMGPS